MRRIAVVPLLALAALLLAGCTSGAGTAQSGADMSGDGGGMPVEMMEMAPRLDGDMALEFATADDVVSADRSVIVTGSVSITADDPIESAAEAVAIVTGAGGRVDSRSESPRTDTQRASAYLVLRIPSDRLDRVLDGLRELGEVNHISTNEDDVTQQREDLDARIAALQASVDRLLALLERAETTTELVEIESALTQRQSELDGLTAQRDWLADQVSYSTISLELVSEGVIEPAGPDDFWSGLVAGWNALLAFLGGLVVGVGVVLPWLALLAIVGGIVLLIVWSSVRGSRRRASAGAATPPATTAPPQA